MRSSRNKTSFHKHAKRCRLESIFSGGPEALLPALLLDNRFSLQRRDWWPGPCDVNDLGLFCVSTVQNVHNICVNELPRLFVKGGYLVFYCYVMEATRTA